MWVRVARRLVKRIDIGPQPQRSEAKGCRARDTIRLPTVAGVYDNAETS